MPLKRTIALRVPPSIDLAGAVASAAEVGTVEHDRVGVGWALWPRGLAGPSHPRRRAQPGRTGSWPGSDPRALGERMT